MRAVLASIIIVTVGASLLTGTDAFQCSRMVSCVEEDMSKLFGLNSSSMSREQLVPYLTVSPVSSLKMFEYQGMLYYTFYS